MADQTWITLFEPMCNTTYTFQSKTLTSSQQESLSLTDFLQIARLQLSSSDYVDFFIKSDSLETAAFLPDDKALSTIYQQHCKSDPVITIIIRPSSDPTPSSSHDAGAIYSFLERIKVNGHKWNASGAIEPERLKHLAKLCTDYPFFENNAKKFVQDLAVCHAVWATDDAQLIARRRLSSVGTFFYLGSPYFSRKSVLDILDTPVQCYTLLDVLKVVARQAAVGPRNEHAACELCTLAPLFVYAFGLTWEGIVDLNLSLQEVDTGKRWNEARKHLGGQIKPADLSNLRQGKNHGKVCR